MLSSAKALKRYVCLGWGRKSCGFPHTTYIRHDDNHHVEEDANLEKIFPVLLSVYKVYTI